MAILVKELSPSDVTDPIEKEIIDILLKKRKAIDIHELYKKVIDRNHLASYEFKYALSHLLANHIVSMDYDGNIVITSK
jgi:hypothetical protein